MSTPTTTNHPLDPLTPLEISKSSSLILQSHQSPTGWIFNSITLKEPPKSLLLPYLNSQSSSPPTPLNYRKASVILICKSTGTVYNATVDLLSSTVESFTSQPPGSQPTLTPEDCFNAERICKESEEVIKRIQELGLDINFVVGDPWSVGYNAEPEFENRRLVQLFMYFRNSEKDNHYAHPLPFVVVVDLIKSSLVSIDDLPTHSTNFQPTTPTPPPPASESNYDPTLLKTPLRKDVSLLEITQPEGPSFTINGNEIEWQKFKIRISFNYREGLVFHNVRYDDNGNIRPLFYRMSLSEMVVPYGDPRPPYHRKCAYDIGDYGLGFCTNDLTLGCDCLGTIKYFPAIFNNHEGQPVTIPHAVCLHEEDAGLLQKHTEYRTNHVVLSRSRRLVFSFIATVVNYEYAFYWYFYQDGTISMEVKATGELSTNMVETDGSFPDHETIVFPNVAAQYHQHIFCARIDPMVDGHHNSISTIDVEAVAAPFGSDSNPYGQGFRIKETPITNEGPSDWEKSRTWRISNPSNIHEYTGKPVGWKLIPSGNGVSLIAGEGSWIRERARFATHSLWVSRFQEGELYAGGEFINQSKKEAGVSEWVKRNGELGDEDDIVVFHSFGVTHIPRVEDFPIMPVETTGFTLKPNNFFTQNPAVDVPPPRSSKSKLADLYLGNKGIVGGGNGCH